MELTGEDRARIITTVKLAGAERAMEHRSFNEVDFLMGALAVFQGAGWWDKQPMWVFQIMAGNSVVEQGQPTIAPVALDREATRSFLQRAAQLGDDDPSALVNTLLRQAVDLLLTDPFARNAYEEAQYELGETIDA